MSAFTEAVESELEGVEAVSVGACPRCQECGLEDVDTMDCPEYESAGEPSFSWSQCEGCGSTFGGDRYPAHGFVEGSLIHFEVCIDCLMYIANGEEPETWQRHPSR